MAQNFIIFCQIIGNDGSVYKKGVINNEKLMIYF
jgi:hypothetical protein